MMHRVLRLPGHTGVMFRGVCLVWMALVSLFLTSGVAHADWPLGISSDSNSTIADFEVAADGSVYVLGTYSGTIRFEDQGGSLLETWEAQSYEDLYIARFSASGYPVWAQRVRGPDRKEAVGLAIGSSGDIYVTGNFQDSVRIGDFTPLVAPIPYEWDHFVAVLNADNGKWIEASKFSVPLYVSVAIEAEPSDDGVYLALENTSDDLASVMVRYEAGTAGTSFAPDPFANPVIGLPGIRDIAAGDEGKVFVMGKTVSGSTDDCAYDSGSAGLNYVSLIQLNKSISGSGPTATTNRSLSCEWSRIMSSTGSVDSRGSLATDGNNVYFWRHIALQIMNESGDPVERIPGNNGYYPVERPAGIGTDSRAWSDVVVDGDGNVFVTGEYGPNHYEPPFTEMFPLLVTDVKTPFVARLGLDGEWEWAQAPARSNQHSASRATTPRLALGAVGDIFLSGNLKGQGIFYTDTTRTVLTSPDHNGAALWFDSNDDHLNLFNYDPRLFDGLFTGDETATVGFQMKADIGALSGGTLFSVADASAGSSVDIEIPAGTPSTELQITEQCDAAQTLVYSFELGGAERFDDNDWHQYSIRRYQVPATNTISYEVLHDGVPLNAPAGDTRSYTGSCPGLVGNPVLGPVGTGGTDGDRRVGFDELRFWEGESGPVLDQQSMVLTGEEPGLRGYWNFDLPENDVDEVYRDLSPNHWLVQVAEWNPDRPQVDLKNRNNYQDFGFIAQLDGGAGDWLALEAWTLGEEVPRPDGTLAAYPGIEIEGVEAANINQYFTWNQVELKLYAIGMPPGAVTINWKTNSDATINVDKIRKGIVVLPDDGIQPHVSGAPVTMEWVEWPGENPGDPVQAYRYDGIAWPADGLSPQENTRFVREIPDGESSSYSVLRFLRVSAVGDTSGSATNLPHRYLVVRTMAWDHASLRGPDVAGQEIGKPIEDCVRHDCDWGRNGFVVPDLAPYDAGIYNRESLAGPIIPVNLDTANRPLVVAWYQPDDRGVHWPVSTIRYRLKWPDTPAPDALVIANLKGAGPLEPDPFLNPVVYHQPDPGLPGFNPNEEHALLAPHPDEPEGPRLFALRDDLNQAYGHSEPYVLLRYRNLGEWAFKVYKVCRDKSSTLCATDASVADANFAPTTPGDLDDPFVIPVGYNGQGRKGPVVPPRPLDYIGPCGASGVKEDGDPKQAGWTDYQDNFWARAANGPTPADYTVFHYYYPAGEDTEFYIQGDEVEFPDGCVPWLPQDESDTPIDVAYQFVWPEEVPVLNIGDTLFKPAKDADGVDFPTFENREAAQVIYDQATVAAKDEDEPYTLSTPMLARLVDPLSPRSVPLTSLGGILTENRGGYLYFTELPASLKLRLYYDPGLARLVFKGWIDESVVGDPHILPNIMTRSEKSTILGLSSEGTAFTLAVRDLYQVTQNPSGLDLDGDNEADGRDSSDPGGGDDGFLVGLDFENPPLTDEDTQQSDSEPDAAIPAPLFGGTPMLSASLDAGEGYVTVAFNNDSRAAGDVSLSVIKVSGCELYRGSLWTVPSDNLFEKPLTLRHSGLFGGNPESVDFEWYRQLDENGQPEVPGLSPSTPDWNSFPNPGDPASEVSITIAGDNLVTLSDNWFVARYNGVSNRTCNGNPVAGAPPSEWAGDISTYPELPGDPPAKAQLATGWIKRVISGLNPFDSRVSDFHNESVSTVTSMIAQVGEPYVADVVLNPDGDAVNELGLLEAYQTVLNQGRELSIDDGIDNPAANTQLLNVSTRISDFYMLLGNEAYADAADPTIGFDTASEEYGTLASSIFAFQNQLDSPLEEELVLLRGRDDSRAGINGHPVNNRLFWNFTQGEGEVAYRQAYGISDQPPLDGNETEADARKLYPMGHGDAWGHYLSAVKTSYELLRNEFFTWIPRTESVLVAGVPIEVDYLDERKFARAAAAKARTGAEIVNLTYREKYVEDPRGQWQGYKDTDTDRAWGLDGWARRAGQGAYFDWLTANSMLPDEDPVPEHEGIEKIDRTTVNELSQIAAQFSAIQAQVDKADAGLNPVGLAKGVVPFDIDPNFNEVGSGNQGETHFEQIANRAQAALDNAVIVFDHANQQTQRLREIQDNVDELTRNVTEQDQDFKNRLIELFGYPYEGDPKYPDGYDGPDIYDYNFISSDLVGTELPTPDSEIQGVFSPIQFGGQSAEYYFPQDLLNVAEGAGSPIAEAVGEVTYPVAPGADWQWVAEQSWGQRRAPGEIQFAISDFLQAQAALNRALKEHENLLEDVEAAAVLLEQEYKLATDTIDILSATRDEIQKLNVGIGVARAVQVATSRFGQITRDMVDASNETIPKSVGTSTDAFAPIRGAVKYTVLGLANAGEAYGDAASITESGLELAKEYASLQSEVSLAADTPFLAAIERVKDLEQLWREEAVLRLELYTQAEIVSQAFGRYRQLLAEGLRIMEERRLFNVTAAADTQDYRYKDMTFRIFRNEALQMYRAHFDLAARYVYLAATAYDYETNLLSAANGSGREFLADIVRERALGQVIDGVPVAGTPGLADVLARLRQNYEVYRGQLGFNNPQFETNRFSLKSEHFRLADENLEGWQNKLESYFEPNLWDVPEFRRFARPFAPESQGAQPGLVIPFDTTVTFGMNFFGHSLIGGDSAYDPTNFATKVRSVGIWFSDYDNTRLSNTPRVYLIPVGMDVLRSPESNNFETREWRVVDQKLPVPFPVGASDLSDSNWIPMNDSLSDTFADIRRFSSFRAYPDNEGDDFDPAETSADSRLIGRSVWNSQWLLIIPSGTLLNSAGAGGDTGLAFDREGIDQLIYGNLIPGETVETCDNPAECRDGETGISDIKLFFSTYGYSGN